MKLWNPLFLLVFFSGVFYLGCGNSDDSTNPAEQASFKGSDYKPLVSSLISEITVNGSVTYYDSLGALTSTEVAQGPMDPKHLFSQDTKKLDELLPDEFKIGQEWFLIGDSNIKIKPAEALANYVSSTGKNFKDVVRLEVTSKDSSGQKDSFIRLETYLYNVYLAKGVGVIDVLVGNYSQDQTSWDYDYYTKKTQKHFVRKVIKGTAGI